MVHLKTKNPLIKFQKKISTPFLVIKKSLNLILITLNIPKIGYLVSWAISFNCKTVVGYSSTASVVNIAWVPDDTLSAARFRDTFSILTLQVTADALCSCNIGATLVPAVTLDISATFTPKGLTNTFWIIFGIPVLPDTPDTTVVKTAKIRDKAFMTKRQT